MPDHADGTPGGAPGPEEQARRDIRDVRTRWRTRQVLDAAVRLINAGGLHGMSMQALAREAQISVGLIYSYFGGKEDVVVAVVADLADQIRREVDARIAAAGDDPVEQLAAGFAGYCVAMDAHRNAGLLTYRQSAELGAAARERLKAAERETFVPLTAVVAEAADAGLLADGVAPDVLVFDLTVLAQVWALKHWHFPEGYGVEHFVADQVATLVRPAMTPTPQKGTRT